MIHITLIKLMLITIQYKEVGNVSQLLLKCINPSIKDLYSSSSDTELPQIICCIVVLKVLKLLNPSGEMAVALIVVVTSGNASETWREVIIVELLLELLLETWWW